MGVTRFTGPVYGAKSLLWSGFQATGGSSGASTGLLTNGAMVVPAYETWYITELQIGCSTQSSNYNFKLKVKGTSTSASAPGPGPDPNFPTGNPSTGVINLSAGGSTGAISLTGVPSAPTPGEYEGYAAPANSSIRLVSTGINPPGAITWNMRGFIRYIDSTRAV